LFSGCLFIKTMFRAWYQGFVFQFCEVSELAYCPQEDLPKLNGVAIGGGQTRHVIATSCE
jgi:hypothetical protein